MSASLLAFDIGGAHLKAANGKGYAAIEPFALWRQPGLLAPALARMLRDAPPCEAIAVTMTGELADCFATKAEGVEQIVAAVVSAAAGRRVGIYQTDGSLSSAEHAVAAWLTTAASNWHALARFAGRQYAPDRAALLIDVGSTTCDIIPLTDGKPANRGKTDPERLACGELVYTGVERSPVCALVKRLRWQGRTCRVAQEVFATTKDAYLTLGCLPEDPSDRATADGRPATRSFARDRLARMICADRSMFAEVDALAAARTIAAAQRRQVGQALREVLAAMPAPPLVAIVSGRGEFLARQVLDEQRLDGPIVSLAEAMGPALSRVAPAHALAVLAAGQWDASSLRQAPSPMPRRVIKLGGSLLDLPDLADRLRRWLAGQPPAENLLLAGGGRLVDVLRDADRLHGLGEEAAHWLCVQAMAIHARMLAAMLPEAAQPTGICGLLVAERPCLRLVDPYVLLNEQERRLSTQPLPACWRVTSDSIAARLAQLCAAEELVLLKSALPQAEATRQTAAVTGYVDPEFPSIAGQLPVVRCVNLRHPGCPEALLR